MDYRKIFFENRGLKLVSLGIALSLWFFVTSKGKMEIALTVPVELQNIPQGMAVVGDVARYLEARVQGPERALRDITTGKKVVGILDLSMTKPGENVVRISPDDIKRPSGVAVTHLSPYEIRVKLEPLVRKTFVLHPELRGTPASGYRLTGASVSPPRVTLEGPAGVMRTLTRLQTMPIDIHGATGDITVEPRIDYRGNPVKLIEKNVSIRVSITRMNR